MNSRVSLAVVALVLGPACAAAQSNTDVAAYNALITTPIGSLVPLVTTAMLGSSDHVGRIAARFGDINQPSGPNYPFAGKADNRMYVASINLPVASIASFTATGGVNKPGCNQCTVDFVGDVGMDVRLAEGSLFGSTRGTIGLGADVGVDLPQNGSTALTDDIAMPVTLIFTAGKMRIAPFVEPAYGHGSVKNNGASISGLRPMLGGGVALLSSKGAGVTLGLQKVFITGGKRAFGLNLVLPFGG